MIEYEPHSLFRIALFGSENTLHASVLLLINRRCFPDGRWRLVRVEVRKVTIVSAFLQEYFADKELTRWDLNQASLECKVGVPTQLSVLGSLLCCTNV